MQKHCWKGVGSWCFGRHPGCAFRGQPSVQYQGVGSSQRRVCTRCYVYGPNPAAEHGPQAWFSRGSPRGVQCHPHPFCWLYISHSQVQSLHVRTQAAVTIWLKGPLSADGVSASQLAGWFRLGWRQSEPVSGYLPVATCHALSYTWALGTEMLSVTPGNNKRAQQITTDHAWL